MTLITADVVDQVLRKTSELEFFTLFTTLDITTTQHHSDNSQKDFESIIQVIGIRVMPVLMNFPLTLDGRTGNVLEKFGAPSLKGPGWVLRFAFNKEGLHTLDTLKNDLNGIVLNAGNIDTVNNINMEITQQDNLYER